VKNLQVYSPIYVGASTHLSPIHIGYASCACRSWYAFILFHVVETCPQSTPKHVSMYNSSQTTRISVPTLFNIEVISQGWTCLLSSWENVMLCSSMCKPHAFAYSC
jgi:hypothetical protein